MGNDNVLLEQGVDIERLIAYFSFLQRFHLRDNLLEAEAQKLAEDKEHASKYRSSRATAIVEPMVTKGLDIVEELMYVTPAKSLK